LPVTLSKLNYRMYFPTMGQQTVFTIRGQFPFNHVVDELRDKKKFLELINEFTIQGGSIRQAQLTGPTQNMDLPVNELSFTSQRSFHSPNFDSKTNMLLAVPLSPYQGSFLPTDLKNVPSNTDFKLTTATGETPQLLIVLRSTQEKGSGTDVSASRLSATLQAFENRAQPQLLPMLDKPQVVNGYEVVIKGFPAPQYLKTFATYSVLSSVEKMGKGNNMIEKRTRLWEVYGQDWLTGFKIPAWPNENLVSGQKRWEVSYVGGIEDKAIDLGPSMLETVTHASHAASDF